MPFLENPRFYKFFLSSLLKAVKWLCYQVFGLLWSIKIHIENGSRISTCTETVTETTHFSVFLSIYFPAHLSHLIFSWCLSQPPGLPVQNQHLQRDPVWVIFGILQIQLQSEWEAGSRQTPFLLRLSGFPYSESSREKWTTVLPRSWDREPKSIPSPGDSEAVNSLSYTHNFSVNFMCFLFCFSIWSIILNLE